MTLGRHVADVSHQARQQGLLDSPWRVHLFGTEGLHVTVDPSGGWQLGEDGFLDYATSDRPGICRATNADVARVRFALIEALNRAGD